MALADNIVTAIMDELGGRSGFDHWFDDIEPGTREEILGQLAIIVQDLIAPVEEEAWMYRDLCD